MKWIQHPVVLQGERVKLVPLESAHFADLVDVAKNEKICQHISIDGADTERLLQHLKSAILKRGTGEQ